MIPTIRHPLVIVVLALFATSVAGLPTDAETLYERARDLAVEGKLDEAGDTLVRAVEAGFRDFDRFADDAAMAPLRTPKNLERVKAALEQATLNRARRSRDEWQKRFDERRYRIDEDPARRLLYASALPERAHAEARAVLASLADHLSATLFDAPPDYEVFIAIVRDADAKELFEREAIGGRYDHRERRLIARDSGAALRHEFVHVMHYGHMERLGQQHRLWVQEGLGALYEDYTLTSGGIVFLPNERTRIIANRIRARRAMPWKDLMDLSGQRFMAQATSLYPQVRSMFRFTAHEGRLEAWYRAYVEHFEEDDSGRRAFEAAFGEPLEAIEIRWRAWALDQAADGRP